MKTQEQFVLEDLLNVLIQLEETGNRHYHKMSTMADNPRLRDLFEMLSKQEQTHKVIYEGYKSVYAGETLNDVTDEYRHYVEVTLKNTIDFIEMNEQVASIDDGLKIAISLEKDTLLFLNEMKKLLVSKTDEIERLMDEERGHLTFLYNYKEEA